MTTKVVKISDLSEIPQLRNFYAPQPIDDLVQSYQTDGQLVPIHISDNNEIINGYRMVDAIKEAGGTTVIAIVMKGKQPTLLYRILLNRFRTKTTNDQVGEIKEVFKMFPKRQGKKDSSGEPYKRDEVISTALNNKWKGDKTIAKLEHIIDNDLENNVLLKGILEKYWKVDTCHEFITDKYKIDQDNNYGFTERITKGEISVADANKLIQKKHWLDNEYKHTFIIPDKANSYNINCVEISKMEEFMKSVDLIFTSPPYWKLRNYKNGDPNQLGHEKTKEEYCKNLSDIFNQLVPTLKESSNVIINIGESYEEGVGCGIPQLLKDYIEKYTSLIYKDTLVWSKPNPKPQNETVQRPINNIEFLLWFVVNPKKSKYRLLTFPVKGKETKISKGCKDVDHNGVVWGKRLSLSPNYGKFYSHLKEQEILNIIETSVGKNHDVYKIYGEGHPAIMSPLLPVVPIMMTTDEGDLVYDPFAGTDVVGRITQLLNRKSLSTELSKDYFKIGCRMLETSVQDYNKKDLDFIQSSVYPEFENEISIAA